MALPILMRFCLVTGSLIGLAPFTFTSILQGRPKFQWLSFGVLFTMLNLAGEGYLINATIIQPAEKGTSNKHLYLMTQFL